MMDKQKPLYFFLHLPRTGGTSLHVMLNNIYRERYTRILDNTSHINEALMLEILKNEPYKYDVITAHTNGFGIHRESVRPIRYLTMMREPVARVLSQYYKVMRNENHRQYALLNQFNSVEEGLPYIHTNLQTLLVSGAPHDRALTDADLETAKHNLEEWFDVVGILERFEDSLLQMRRVLGWKRPVIMPLHRNAGSNRPKETTDSVRRAAAELNHYDVELYRFANELMDKRIRAIGVIYQRDKFEVWSRRTTRHIKAFIKQRLAHDRSK